MAKKPRKLTSRQAAFCRNLIQGMTGAEAAREAGYKNGGRQAYQLLEKPHIQAYLAELKAEVESDAIMSGREVLERWTATARGEGVIPRSTPTGIHELPPDWSDRHAALKELAKYHTLYVDRKEITLKKPPAEMRDAELLEALSELASD